MVFETILSTCSSIPAGQDEDNRDSRRIRAAPTLDWLRDYNPALSHRMGGEPNDGLELRPKDPARAASSDARRGAALGGLWRWGQQAADRHVLESSRGDNEGREDRRRSSGEP